MGSRAKKKPKAARRKTEPADWQEAHSPTVEHTIRGDVRLDASGTPRRQVIGIARRRKDDAELVMGLDPAQIQAAEELRTAYMAIVGVVGVRGASYEQRVDQQRGAPEGIIPDRDITTHHAGWVRACREARPKVDVDAVHAVICEGYSCRWVNRARGRGSDHWAATQVRRGLDLWHQVRPRRAMKSPRASPLT